MEDHIFQTDSQHLKANHKIYNPIDIDDIPSPRMQEPSPDQYNDDTAQVLSQVISTLLEL